MIPFRPFFQRRIGQVSMRWKCKWTWIAQRSGGHGTGAGVGAGSQRRHLRDLNLVLDTVDAVCAGWRVAHIGHGRVHGRRHGPVAPAAGARGAGRVATGVGAVGAVGAQAWTARPAAGWCAAAGAAAAACRQLTLADHLQFARSIPLVHRSEFVSTAAHPIRSNSCFNKQISFSIFISFHYRLNKSTIIQSSIINDINQLL